HSGGRSRQRAAPLAAGDRAVSPPRASCRPDRRPVAPDPAPPVGRHGPIAGTRARRAAVAVRRKRICKRRGRRGTQRNAEKRRRDEENSVVQLHGRRRSRLPLKPSLPSFVSPPLSAISAPSAFLSLRNSLRTSS